MNYPTYTINDLNTLPKDGSSEIEEFHNFIADLFEKELFAFPSENKAAQRILAHGTTTLTTDESETIEALISRYTGIECNQCGLEVSLSEIPLLRNNGGLCRYCGQEGN